MYDNLRKQWLSLNTLDSELEQELKNMNNTELESAFWKDLSFGTGGLRGLIGAGSNRMNYYTVARACRGIANYLLKKHPSPTVAISYDSRIHSQDFAELSAAIFAEKGISVQIFNQIMPTPILSFAVRYLKCSAGIMITASHNPSEYNGYKVYDHTGCQITLEAAEEIQKEILKHDILSEYLPKFSIGEKIRYIDNSTLEAYYDYILSLRVSKPKSNVKIVYSALNGCGNIPVRHILSKLKYIDLEIVKEQEKADGNFPTCPYPNPEENAAMELACQLTIKTDADICIATDPDCDRVGLGVRHGNEIVLLNGNDVGVLLLDYIAAHKVKEENKNYYVVKTIVSTDMAKDICKHYGIKLFEVLTGFKFIGEQIAKHEDNNALQFLFGFEESCGYLSGTSVRDKDAVNAVVLIADMLSEHKDKGITLIDKLKELKQKYGYYSEKLISITLEGLGGAHKINKFMQEIRANKDLLNRLIPNITNTTDYLNDNTGLPLSDVLCFYIDNNKKLIIRPSGTEPKLKFYLFAKDSLYTSNSLYSLENIVNYIGEYID